MNGQRFFPCRERDDNAISRINITNLVDIALTMVVILLMVSPFIEQGMNVKLPVSGPARISVEKSIIVTVAGKNMVFIGNRRVSFQDLKHILEERVRANPETGVIVKGDQKIFYQELIDVLDVVKNANVHKVGLATTVMPAK